MWPWAGFALGMGKADSNILPGFLHGCHRAECPVKRQKFLRSILAFMAILAISSGLLPTLSALSHPPQGFSGLLLQTKCLRKIDPCVTRFFPLHHAEFSTGLPKLLLGSRKHSMLSRGSQSPSFVPLAGVALCCSFTCVPLAVECHTLFIFTIFSPPTPQHNY
jgi:hypothetical protein